MSSYYELLGISSGATEKDIRKAYRLKAKLLHPDVNASPDAQQKFQLLHTAYETLIDKNKRYYYDHKISAPSQSYDYYSKYYQKSYYDEWIRVQKEKKAYEAKLKQEEFLRNKEIFRQSFYYYPFYAILYIAASICYLFGLGVLGVCGFLIYKTHLIFTFFLSPFICGGVYFIKCTGTWYIEAKRYF